MNRRADRRHLQFDRVQAELLDGACATNTAISDEGGGLVIPLPIGMVECVLQDRSGAVVIFGGRKDIAVERGHFFSPDLRVCLETGRMQAAPRFP